MEFENAWVVRCGNAYICKDGGWTENPKQALELPKETAVTVAEDFATIYDNVYVAEPVK